MTFKETYSNGANLTLATVGILTVVGWLNNRGGGGGEYGAYEEIDVFPMGGSNRRTGSRATKQDLVNEIVRLEPRRSKWRLPSARAKLMRLPKSQLVAIKDEMEDRFKSPSWKRRRRFTGEWNRPTRQYKDFVRQRMPHHIARGLSGAQAMTAIGNEWRKEI
ncbi:hypothetical protein CMI47_09390 [Candidatus Pacearchaeota archaeon]|nr:hypothetical protein [Candidatus Pacearchaeota archaeon]